VRINLLWPRWAELVAPLNARTIYEHGWQCWKTVQRAGELVANRLDYERIAKLRRERPGARASGHYSPGAAARWLMVLVVALGVSTIPSRAAAADKWLVALQAAGAADLVSTEIWLHQGPQGAVELNPLGQHLGNRIALKVGYNTFAWWTAKKLERDGHARWANVLRYTALWMQLGAAGWNVNLTLTR
jgi:hypothetical protein